MMFLKLNVTEFSIVVGQSNTILYGEDAQVQVTLLGVGGVGLNETLTVIVNNRPYTVAVTNGKGSFNVSGLSPGSFSAVGLFSGNDHYLPADAVGQFSVLKPGTKLTIDVDDIVVGDVLYVKINLTDADGNPILGLVTLSGDLYGNLILRSMVIMHFLLLVFLQAVTLLLQHLMVMINMLMHLPRSVSL